MKFDYEKFKKFAELTFSRSSPMIFSALAEIDDLRAQIADAVVLVSRLDKSVGELKVALAERGLSDE